MIIEMGYLFNRNGATLPVELVEQIDDAKDYPDVVEFAEPVKIEGTLKNEDDVFVLDAKGETAVLMECSCCLAPYCQRKAMHMALVSNTLKPHA